MPSAYCVRSLRAICWRQLRSCIYVLYMSLFSSDKLCNVVSLHQRLRGSSSTLSTATSQVNGRWRILTPTESKTLSRLQQNSAQLITSATSTPKPNLVQLHTLGASGHMGAFCAFIDWFILPSHRRRGATTETREQVRPVDAFLRTIAQKTWNHARMCLFGVI